MSDKVNNLYSEIITAHTKLIKLNQSKRFDLDYFNEISELEEQQTLINNQLKRLGWRFDYEHCILVEQKRE